ncbi:MAG TPA: SRPBCC family protein [Flavobacteriaceae bacterium]|nr:SRPBCC family protein [Flavobacteriaceae bacterium]
MKYQLQKVHQLNCDLLTAWEFFSSPFNLAKITPDNMGFDVLTNINGAEMYEGMEIDYKVTPLFGIPMKWKTKITQVEPYKSFTDFQEEGPYKLWNHHHEFIENKEGVLMNDFLTYEMPYGVLGRIAHTLIVKKKLKSIFDYRFQVLEELFNREKQ